MVGKEMTKWFKIGGGIGFLCGMLILVMGWDNYGILALASGPFTSGYIFASLFNTKFFLRNRFLNAAIYVITASLSWGILGYLKPKKLFLLFYVLIWIILGGYATIIVAVAYA